MKIALLTGYTANMSPWANILAEGKEKYCKKHNYTYIFNNNFDNTRPPAWSKVKFLQNNLSKYDWVFWTDADSMILNFDKKLEDFILIKDISICQDCNGINSGLFLIKNTNWSKEFLKLVWEQKHHINACWWEQCAFMDLLKISREHWNLLPQHFFNSHPTTYKYGDFVMHMSGMGNSERAEFAAEYHLLCEKSIQYTNYKIQQKCFKRLFMSTDTFDASGTWTCPAGVTSVQVSVWGGGAGGQGAFTPNPFLVTNGHGGGGGGYSSGSVNVVPATGYNVVVGSGGGGGAGTFGSFGSAGGDSSFSGISASGGMGNSNGGAGDTTGGNGANPGSGGSGGNGGAGGTPNNNGAAPGGGGGGGSGAFATGGNGANGRISIFYDSSSSSSSNSSD